MDSLPPFLVHVLELPPLLKYGAIVLISMFEGPILFTVSGFFLRLGTEQFLPIAIALGNFLGDTLWYCFGYFFAGRMIRSQGSFLGITSDHLLKAERIFESYQGRVLFFTKGNTRFRYVGGHSGNAYFRRHA
jgi:membrane protein DedA with SNARE-associated domain